MVAIPVINTMDVDIKDMLKEFALKCHKETYEAICQIVDRGGDDDCPLRACGVLDNILAELAKRAGVP